MGPTALAVHDESGANPIFFSGARHPSRGETSGGASLLTGLEAIQAEPQETTEPMTLKRRDFWTSPFVDLADVD